MRTGLFAGAYFLCAYVSRTLTSTLNFEASFWLPSGLFLGVLLVAPRAQWTHLVAGSFVGSFFFNLQGANWPLSWWLLAHVGNVATALLAAWAVQRFAAPRPGLKTVRELVVLFFFGALLANLVSATAGAWAVHLSGSRAEFMHVWRSWLMSNVVGVVLLTPAILAWQGTRPWTRLRRHHRRLEGFLIVGLLTLAVLISYTFRGAWMQMLVLQFLPIPFVIWAAIRFETRGVTILSLLIALLLSWATIWDYGVETGSGLSARQRNVSLQLNLIALSFFGLFPAIVISAHRRTTEALQASEARYTRALRGAGDGLWEWNIITGSSYYSARWKEMLGFTEPELANDRDESFVSRIHPEDLPRVQRALRAHLDQRVPYDVEFRLMTKEGDYRWFRSRGEAERNADGLPIRVAGTLQDVTERVQAEESLRESRRALATLMSNLPGMAYRCRNDPGWSLEFASEGARELTGYTPAELLSPTGVKFADLIHPEDLGMVWNEIQASVSERRAYRLSYRIFDAKGAEKWVWEQGLGVCDDEGGVVALEGFITDITERKRLEQQVLRSQRRESIGTLAAGVAHNLNNMLVPIVMGTELLRMPTTPAENERVLDNIERSAKRAADLVRQLLAFGRGLDGARAKVLVPQVIAEVESIITNTFPKNIELRTSCADHLRPIVGDATQLHQVLLNLCLNARDAMPDGGVLRIVAANFDLAPAEVARHRGLAPGRYVSLEISDTGFGMTREVCERIFEPFFTTKEVNKGTGLGLSTVLGIVRSHGGAINVTSAPGEGSCFTVHLPAMDESLPPLTEVVPGRPAGGKGEQILLVDDEAGVLSVMRRSLETAGYRVLTAPSGEQALEIYTRYRTTVALVITDLMMPGMDGTALIHALRQLNSGVKIIAISGLPAQAGCPRLPVACVLDKPLEAAVLLAAIERVLQPSPAYG